MELRELVAALIDGLGSNNSAGKAISPYREVGLPPISMGAGQGSTIYDMGGLPADTVQRGRDVIRSQLPQGASGIISQYVEPKIIDAPTEAAVANPSAPVLPRVRVGTTRVKPRPKYDTYAFDKLMTELSQGPTEGPNVNIDDATRQRALAWALRNNSEG